MRFKSSSDFLKLPSKALTVFGMSGVGKTTLATILQSANWFHYSVDYRIGTRYMDEHIVDNFKREAMKNPFLRSLLMSDSIYIKSNITIDNLEPLSTYLGKPGNPDLGGIPFTEYLRRQTEHREAEINALLDVPRFIRRAGEIYSYKDFICDTGGSLCEVTNPDDQKDNVLSHLSEHSVLVYVKGTTDHLKTLVERFRKYPKPMYYRPEFLQLKWLEFKHERKIVDDNLVNPDEFAVWGFEQLLLHRLPLYEKIAENFGYTIRMQDVAALKTEEDVLHVIAAAIDKA